MKKILFVSLLAGLTACAKSQDSQSSAALPLHSIGSGLLFSQDARPADGNLTELSISRNSAGSYDAKLRVLTSGFGSPITDTSEDLGQGLRCFAAKNRQTLVSVTCSRDDRPVDGQLRVLTVSQNGEGGFTARLQLEYYKRLEGRPVFESKEVAFGLALQPAQF